MHRVDDIYERVEEASNGFSISIESSLQQGFNLFRQAPLPFVLYSLVFLLILSNPVSGLLLGGPALAGYYIMARQLDRGREISVSELLEVMKLFTPLLLLQVLIAFLISLGLVLLIVPGVYFAVSYIFAIFFVWLYGQKPTEAIRLSRKLVSGNFGHVFLLSLVLLGINLLGLMAFGIGLLVSMPIAACTLYAVFNDITGIQT